MGRLLIIVSYNHPYLVLASQFHVYIMGSMSVELSVLNVKAVVGSFSLVEASSMITNSSNCPFSFQIYSFSCAPSCHYFRSATIQYCLPYIPLGFTVATDYEPSSGPPF